MGDSSAPRDAPPAEPTAILAAASGADLEPAAPFDGAVSSRVRRGCKEKNEIILSTTRRPPKPIDTISTGYLTHLSVGSLSQAQRAQFGQHLLRHIAFRRGVG